MAPPARVHRRLQVWPQHVSAAALAARAAAGRPAPVAAAGRRTHRHSCGCHERSCGVAACRHRNSGWQRSTFRFGWCSQRCEVSKCWTSGQRARGRGAAGRMLHLRAAVMRHRGGHELCRSQADDRGRGATLSAAMQVAGRHGRARKPRARAAAQRARPPGTQILIPCHAETNIFTCGAHSGPVWQRVAHRFPCLRHTLELLLSHCEMDC
jgi:hypothetical protein